MADPVQESSRGLSDKLQIKLQDLFPDHIRSWKLRECFLRIVLDFYMRVQFHAVKGELLLNYFSTWTLFSHQFVFKWLNEEVSIIQRLSLKTAQFGSGNLETCKHEPFY